MAVRISGYQTTVRSVTQPEAIINGHDDDDRRMDDDDDRRTRADRDVSGTRDGRCARPADGTFGSCDDRPAVELSVDERILFHEIVSSMWLLRVTGGRCATILAQPWVCVFVAAVGTALGTAALGRLPIAVSFAGFVLVLIGVAELSRYAPGSRWGRRVKELLGLELMP